ncbi:MAG: cytochrome c biogenesis CcdA family protein [Tepidiformaceae bacterium]
MATRVVFGRRLNNRALLYVLFGTLALLPVLAFGVAGADTDRINLEGPGGPILAFSAGLLSFFSPCVLPLVPIYLTHISGASIEGGKVVSDRRVTFSHAMAFCGGLSLVFIVLGASVGLLGSYVLQDRQRELERVAGTMLVLMGLLLIPAHGRRSPMRSALLLVALTILYVFLAEVADLRGDRGRLLQLGIVLGFVWVRFAGYLQLPWLLSRSFEVAVPRRKVGYTRSALVGGAFAVGWTPCVGPILSSILALGLTQSDALSAVYLLAAYSAGLSLPFLIAGLALGDTTRFLKRIQPYAPVLEVAGGLLLVGLGVLLITGRLTGLNSYFSFAGSSEGGL